MSGSLFRFCNKLTNTFSWRRQHSNVTMRIAVVGAGPAGLVTLYTIRNRLLDQIPGLDVVAYERSDEIGGEWVFSNKPESYQDGLPMNSSMYRGLQTNVPNPLTQIHPDFPWPEKSPLYPYREDFLKYIRDFATTFNLPRYVEFSKLVTQVRRDNDGVIVDVKDLISGLATLERFDFVFFCCGQHRKPFIPQESEALSQFSGRVIHYHDLRDPACLYGKRVVVVGSLFGALDMFCMLADKVQELCLCWHNNKPFWQASIEKYAKSKPKIAKAIGDEVIFEDGSSMKADVIVYATGFRQVHPLAPQLELDFTKSACIFPLYKHVVHPFCSSMFFIGKGYNYIIQSLRLHAEFACAVINRRVALPSKEEMLRDIECFQTKWTPEIEKMFEGDVTKYFPIFELEFEMADDLAYQAQCQPIPPFIKQISYDLFRVVRDDAFNYRRYRLVEDYKNTLTKEKFSDLKTNAKKTTL